MTNYNTMKLSKKRLVQIFLLLLVFYSIWSFNIAVNPSKDSSDKQGTTTYTHTKNKPIKKFVETNISDEKIEDTKEEHNIEIIEENKDYPRANNNNNNNIDGEHDTIVMDNKEAKKNLENDKYDYAITVLGYQLYEDGMPTKILKDRVSLAAEHYRELKEHGSSPIILLSGKFKPNKLGKDPAYSSEAEAMFSLLLSHEVSKNDIHLDSESENTAQNAKNTLTLISKHKIKNLIIVTSDFHVLRSQYIFQVVMPGNIELEFYGAPTSEKIREANRGSERSLFKSSQNDLDVLHLLELPNEKSWGYHPIRNLPRWRMIEREIEYDINHYRSIEKGSLMVDYGSNQGYFSIHMSQKVKSATMVSLEGEAVKEYKSAASEHEEKIQELNITNNYLCRTTIKTPMFTQLNSNSHVYEYQLCLSVFHWFGMQDKESFETVLYNQLMNSKTTFLELPEAMNYVGREGQHAWDSVNKWYGGRSEVEILTQLKDKYKMNMTWKVLGALMHDNETVRKVIRIDVRGSENEIDDPRKPLDLDSLKEIYSCGKLMHN